MDERQLLDSVTVDPKVMAGKSVVRGTRLSVEYVLNLLAHGSTEHETWTSIMAWPRKTSGHVCYSPASPWRATLSCRCPRTPTECAFWWTSVPGRRWRAGSVRSTRYSLSMTKREALVTMKLSKELSLDAGSRSPTTKTSVRRFSRSIARIAASFSYVCRTSAPRTRSKSCEGCSKSLPMNWQTVSWW